METNTGKILIAVEVGAGVRIAIKNNKQQGLCTVIREPILFRGSLKKITTYNSA